MSQITVGNIEVIVHNQGVEIANAGAYLSGPMLTIEDWPQIRDFIDQALKLRTSDGRRIMQLRCACGLTFPLHGKCVCQGGAGG